MVDGIRDTRYHKLGALSLLGVAGVIVLLYALLFWAGARSALGGVDEVHGLVIRVSALVPAVLMILASLALARTVLADARHRG